MDVKILFFCFIFKFILKIFFFNLIESLIESNEFLSLFFLPAKRLKPHHKTDQRHYNLAF